MDNYADIRELRVIASEYQKKMGKQAAYSRERDEVQSIYAPSRHDSASDLFESEYHLPEYQREYTWEPEKEIIQFLETIFNGIYQIDKGNYVYPIGNMIILKERIMDADNNEIIKKSLIDGQQRFTTELASLLIVRYLLNNAPKISKSVNDKATKYANKITKTFMHSYIGESGEIENSFVLNCPTRPDYDAFLKKLISDDAFVKEVLNNKNKYVNSKKTKPEDIQDLSVSNLANGLSAIYEYLAQPTHGLADEDKIGIIEFYIAFGDYILKNLMHGIVELTNAEKARRAYYLNNFTGQHLSEYEGFKYSVITHMPEEKHVEYSQIWDKLKRNYANFANTKVKDPSGGMGFLTLARSNFKGRYTKLKGGHGVHTEIAVYSAVKDTVLRENVDFMAHCSRLDGYFRLLSGYQKNPYFSGSTKRNIHLIASISTTSKWYSFLVTPFDILGEQRGYAVMEKTTDILHKFIGFLLTGRDTTNVSVFDDNLDSIICDLYRRDNQSPYLDEQDFLTTLESIVKKYYKTKNGKPMDREIFKASWDMTCNNSAIRKGVNLFYEFMYDPAGFYYRFNNGVRVEHCTLVGKFANNIESEFYNMASRSRWGYAFFDFGELYKSDIYKGDKPVTITEYNKLVDTALQKLSPATAALWMKTVGKNMDANKTDSFKEYSSMMCEDIMNYLNIPE